jgi:hypothetical protein
MTLAVQHKTADAAQYKTKALDRAGPGERAQVEAQLAYETDPTPMPATLAYIKNLQAEAVWIEEVKETFDQDKIKTTCASYKPDEYSSCYLNFATRVSEKKQLSTNGIVLLESIGLAVSLATYDGARNPAEAADRSELKIQKGLDAFEIVLTLLEMDQKCKKNRKLWPASPEADALLLITNATDDRFQMQTLEKIEKVLTQTASSPCFINGTCPKLASRHKTMEETLERLKAAAPKTYRELTESEIEAATAKIHVSPEQLVMMLGAH